jgi:hypothetical protein
MSGGLSTDQAARLLYDQLHLDQRPGANTTTEDAWLAFVRFARLRFDTPDSPDADGLLHQYGVFSFDGLPAFSLDLTRQFEVVDNVGEHDYYVQVHCELRYDLIPALTTLGTFQSWFFHDSGEDLDQWAEALTSRDAWAVIREHRPRTIKVYQEPV